ncbi:MAG: hypothetical protein KAX19_12950, partial [Candidatus Brocadiae bacterium]|nr:hypothetical protein [Candidatus Brocadiia bacterium]
PEAGRKLEAMVKEVLALGPMITFEEACRLPPLEDGYYVEDRFAWHRTYADVWANTPESKRFDPVIAQLREELRGLEARAQSGEARALIEKAWFHLTCSENSDGRWPPPPAKTCPFNVRWVEHQIERTRETLAELTQAVR